jgi:hypothetical protein
VSQRTGRRAPEGWDGRAGERVIEALIGRSLDGAGRIN